MGTRPKCVVVLSTKSAGSSALQELLRQHAGARCVEHTRHAQHETLYWTKAASMLSLPQVRIPDSEVPFSARRGTLELHKLLSDNVPDYPLSPDARQLVFGGWRALCQRYAPVFIEKSPHHLHEWSALELILDAERELTEIDFRYIGLVRNPMDVFYSMWNRRRDNLAKYQAHWQMAYENLLKFQQLAGKRLVIVKYEDLWPPGRDVEAVFNLLELKPNEAARSFMHGKSRQLWREDRWFGLTLDPEVLRLAKHFGYRDDELANDSFPFWPAYRSISRFDPRFWNARWRSVRRRLRNVY